MRKYFFCCALKLDILSSLYFCIFSPLPFGERGRGEGKKKGYAGGGLERAGADCTKKNTYDVRSSNPLFAEGGLARG
jgi:hypothetical protein